MTAERASRWVSGTINVNVLLSFAFGVLFLAVMLVFAVAFPNPSPSSERTFIVVLAVAAGGVGAVLPGFLEVERKGLFRAGGALGLAALVLVLFSQATVKNTVIQHKRPAENIQPLADAFLRLNDEGRIAEAWETLDPEVRKFSFRSLADYQTIYRNFREPLGKATWRQVVGVGGGLSPPGLPDGLYDQVMYRTKFAGEEGCRYEWVVFRAGADIRWRVATYNIEPHAGACPPQMPPQPARAAEPRP